MTDEQIALMLILKYGTLMAAMWECFFDADKFTDEEAGVLVMWHKKHNKLAPNGFYE